MISVQHARYSTCGLLIDKSLDLRVPRQDSVVNSQTHHSTRMVIGTKAYMPPEYLQSGHMSVKTDSYAFGKTHVRLMGLFGCVVVLPLEKANTAPFVLIRAVALWYLGIVLMELLTGLNPYDSLHEKVNLAVEKMDREGGTEVRNHFQLAATIFTCCDHCFCCYCYCYCYYRPCCLC